MSNQMNLLMVINICGIIIPFVASESILSVLFEMKTKGNRGNNGNIEAVYLFWRHIIF